MSYLDNNELTLKIEKQVYNNNCMTDSIITHFNLKERITYSEWWRITCDNPDTVDNDLAIFKIKTTYYRYEYDKENRVTKQVIHISTPYTRRIIYNYDSKGNVTLSVKSIEDYEFWD